jgi:hypothetical protein
VQIMDGSSASTTYNVYKVRTPAGSFPKNTPAHVAVTYNKSGTAWNIYINGVLQSTTSTTSSSVFEFILWFNFVVVFAVI